MSPTRHCGQSEFESRTRPSTTAHHERGGRSYRLTVRTALWLAADLDLLGPLADANRVYLMLEFAAYGAGHRAHLGLADYDGDDPLFFSAVAEAGHVIVPEVVRLVTELWRGDPERFSTTKIRQWASHHALDIVELLESPRHYGVNRDALVSMLISSPDRPAAIDDALIRSAVLGSEFRQRALSVIDTRYTQEVLAYLDRGQRERIGVAEWIRIHPSPEATSALLSVVRSERDDRVKAAVLTTLETLGIDLEEFLSPEALRLDAAATMSKKTSRSKAIDWLDTAGLPPLRWMNGDLVDGTIVDWFLHSAAKNKSAVPSPIVRRHFSRMTSDSATDFGLSLLEAWMERDLMRVSSADALKEATMLAQSQHRMAQQYPAHRYTGLTIEQIKGMLLPECEAKFAGSARTSQGILALVAASASPTAVDLALSYIRKHRSKRASQSKALIEMLAWMDEPRAVQTVMSMANRFNPKALQQEAARQIKLLADHRGWSVDDLADRSVPDGGFDQRGRRTFEFGARTFTAQLSGNPGISLIDDSSGKTIRSLPRGRADEDPEQVKGQKSALKEATADVAAAQDFQPQRLRRAMATERTWSSDEFNRYILGHPPMVRLATRLLWSTTVAGVEVLYRPLVDGSLLTMDDEELVLDDQPVRIAHGLRLDRVAIEAAATHLSDYEVVPLFSQLDRRPIEVARGQRTLDVVAGCQLSANLLASRARSLGWQVADTGGAGFSVGVTTQFADLGLEAVLSVERGLFLGGYDHVDYDCTLSSLYVIEGGSNRPDEHAALELGQLSPVLIAEIVDDALIIAGHPGA